MSKNFTEFVFDENLIYTALKEAARIQNETVKQREEEAAQRIISEDFADKTDIEKDAMRSVLAKGMEDVGKSWREAKEEAVNAWIDMLGNREHVETIQRKQKEGESEVSVIDFVGEGGQYETKRVSGNEGWYRDAFKKEGKMPSQRSIMDYDHDETVREMEAGGATKEDIDALNRYKEKVEALEGLEDYVKTLDNKHLTAKILLSKDTFDKVYTPFVEELEKGNEQVKKAAKDSALILSKMAETLSRAYGVAVEDIAATLKTSDKPQKITGDELYQRLSPYKVKSYTADELETTATITGKEFGEYTDIKDLRAKALTYYKEHLQGTFAHNDLLGDIRLSDEIVAAEEVPGDVKLTGRGKKKMTHTTGNITKLFVVKKLKDIIGNANIIAKAVSKKEKHKGWTFYYLHGAIDTPDGKQYVVVTVSDKGEGSVDYYNHNVFDKDAYNAIEKATGETSSKGFSRTPQKFHEVASSIHSIYEAEEIYKREKTYNQTVNRGIASEAKLTQDEAAFSHNVDLFMDGELKGGNVKVMTTPLVMKLVGAEILPVYIHQNVLAKILKHGKKVDGIHGHANEMDADILKQLPKALTDPMAIVESKGKPVVITSLVDKNRDTIIVPFVLEKKIKEEKYYTANLIGSAYGKKSNQWILDKILGNLLYINKKRTDDWRITSGLQLPIEAAESSVPFDKFTVPNESDLVKLKNANPEYYQQKEEYAGAYEAENNAIHIFSAGNESTAIHEGAHFFLSTLEKLSQDTAISEEARGKIEEDLSVIRNWASYSPDVMKEYRRTALSKEFREYEKAIKENPDDESAKERFMQERFARGFERYLLTGKAPSKELQGAFRRFKSWLTNLYRSAMNLGKADAPEEMKQIFDKMVATEEEIEAWGEEVKARSLAEDINKLNKAVDTNKSEAGNIKEWLENIKEAAKEKALAHFMKQYKGELLTQFDTAAEEKGETGSRDFLFGGQERLCLIKEFYGKIINMDIPVGYERIYYADTMVSRSYGQNQKINYRTLKSCRCSGRTFGCTDSLF